MFIGRQRKLFTKQLHQEEEVSNYTRFDGGYCCIDLNRRKVLAFKLSKGANC